MLCLHFEYPNSVAFYIVISSIFALSDAILKHDLSNEYKAVDCPWTNKQGVDTRTRYPLLCSSTSSRLTYSSTDTVFRVCSLVASDYTLLWHHARTQSVKAALENLNTQKSTSRRILTDALPKKIQNILNLGQIYALNFGVLDLYNKYRINISKILAKVTRHPRN